MKGVFPPKFKELAVLGYGDLLLINEAKNFLFYRGTTHDEVPVMVKISNSPTASASELHQLEHEFQIARELSGEVVIRPLKIERAAGQTALILELPSYPNLKRLLGAPLEIETFLQIAIGVTSVLVEIHEQGIVHKDICPENIFVTRTGKAKLGGFGLASRLSRERQSPIIPKEIAGNLAYIAPEQTGRMNRSVDTRSDLYTLGVIFYQLLTSRLPFTASDPMEWVHCHIAIQPKTPREHHASIPAQLSELIMKLLSKAAEDRYQTAVGLKVDLERCLAEWRKHGTIRHFELGRLDTTKNLVIPEKLYGREREVKILLDAVDRVVASGKAEVLLVSGYSGVGKSVLINEMHKSLVLPNAIYAEAKFDQYKRDIPYAIFAHILQTLVFHVNKMEKEDIAVWRRKIKKAVEPSGKIITDLVPDLVSLIGEQPDVAEVSPQDAKSRNNNVIRRFIEVFALAQHPLVLFLDDMQWLDSASLELVEYLLTHPNLKHQLILGAYRDNEVGPNHPLTQTIKVIRQSGVRLSEIELKPLTIDAVCKLIAAALRCDTEKVMSLARLLHEKTDGNPFFVTQFLTVLADEKLIVFNPDAGEWSWDLDGILAKSYSQNVVDLMIGKLFGLPDDVQKELSMLACMGNKVRLADLIRVLDVSERDIKLKLQDATKAGLLHMHGDYVAFVHDKVQEAAYALIPEQEKPQIHLSIGRKVLSLSSPETLEDTVFDVVNHLNRGVKLIDDQLEKTTLAELNSIAGRKACASTAHASAANYFKAAAVLMPEKSWSDNYDFMYALYTDWAETEYLKYAYEEAEYLFSTLLSKARSDLDKVRVHILRMKLYPVAGMYDDALAAGIEALRLMGETVPNEDAEINQAIAAEAKAVKNNLEGRSISELAEAPEVTDSLAGVMIDILTGIGGPAYIGSRPELYPLIAYKNINMVLEYGVNREACHALSGYSILQMASLGDLDTAYKLSQAAIAVSERFGELAAIGSTLYLHGNHVNFWLKPFSSCFPILERGFRACADAGNLAFANYIGYSIVWQAIERGDALGDVLNYSRNYADFALESGNEAIYHSIILEQQFVKCLMGRSDGATSFSDDSINEQNSIAAIETGSFTCGLTYYHTMKMFAAYLVGDDHAALFHAEQSWQIHSAVLSQPMQAMFYILHSLVLTRRCRNSEADEKSKILETLMEYQTKLAFWAEHCPSNFACKHLLVAAEIAEVEKDELSAVRLFEQAIEIARDSGFVHWEAIANEAAARYHSTNGLKTVAHTYLRKARSCYEKWGADAKVRQLDSEYIWLTEEVVAKSGTATSIRVEQLDLMALLKAQHAISCNMVPEQLAETLLRIVIEAAGAQSGYLSIEPDIQLFGAVGTHRRIQISREPTSTFSGVAESILDHVRHTFDSVLLSDAREDAGDFANDPYLLQACPKSVLCLPIIRSDEFRGLIYLENNLVSRAFTSDQSTILMTLASQAAISLENANLYINLRESEGRFRTLVDKIQSAIVVHDVNTQILSANTMAQDILGLSEEQLIGKAAIDPAWHFLREDGSVMPEAEYPIFRALNSVSPLQNYVVGVCRPDREEAVWTLVNAIPLYDDLDRVTQVIVSFTDITEQKNSEKSLVTSEQLFRTMVENSPDNIARYDLNLRCVYLNPSLQKQFTLPVAKAIGKTSMVSSYLIDPEQYMDNIRRVIESGQERSDEIPFHNPKDEMCWASTRFVPEFDVDGQVESVLVISNDITEKKLAEEERQDNIRFLESLDCINKALQSGGDIETILKHTLDVVLDIFDCDRTFLEYPCDPDAIGEWRMPVESCVPDYPCPLSPGENLPFHPHFQASMHAMLKSDGPIKLSTHAEVPIPTEITQSYGVQSMIAMVLLPKVDRPWQFSIQQCSFERIWTEQEVRLFEEIGRRLSDRLNSLLITRNLSESEGRLRQLFDSSPLPIREEDYSAVKTYLEELGPLYKDDLLGYLSEHADVVEKCAHLLRVTDVNRTALDFHEAGSKEELLGNYPRIFSSESMQDFPNVLVALMQGKTSFFQEAEILTLSGRKQHIIGYFSVTPGYEQSLERVLVTLVDITDRKRYEDQMRLATSVFANSQESIIISDADNRIIDINPAFTRTTGYTFEDVLGQDPKLLASGRQSKEFYVEMWDSINRKGEWRGEIWNKRKSGEEYPELLSVVAVKDADGELQHYVGAFTDITMLKQHEEDLDRIAHYDVLTSVPNRRLLDDRMAQAIANAVRRNSTLAVCYLDLDGFKPINDEYGHEAGDLVLVEIASRLRKMLRAADTIARLGGDEFVLLWNDIGSKTDCIKALERVMNKISQPIQFGDNEVSVSASIGVTLYPDDDVDADSLLRHADHAMYSAKQLGKNCYQIFDTRLERLISARVEFIEKIMLALNEGQFELYYQPKVDYFSNSVQGVEALLRWNDPILGLVGPKEFLPLIEHDNLAYDVGRWVMNRAVQQAYTWNSMGIMLPISINVFPRHMKFRSFAADIKEAIDSHWPDMPPGRLQMEIVESSALEDLDLIESVIEECREMGISFSLDDFGTGFSSLVYLRRLSIDELKIDQSFVRDMLNDANDQAIVTSVIMLGEAFGLRVVAEGVETTQHAWHLMDLGCRVVQGYALGRPMSVNDLEKWYAEFLTAGVKMYR